MKIFWTGLASLIVVLSIAGCSCGPKRHEAFACPNHPAVVTATCGKCTTCGSSFKAVEVEIEHEHEYEHDSRTCSKCGHSR